MSDRFSGLEFHHMGSEIETAEFVSCVNRALGSCKGKCCENFVVRFKHYDEYFASDVDAWVDFCVKNEVKNFSLAIDNWVAKNHYTPPPIMYLGSSLVTLHLERCIMPSKGTIGWQSLTRLSLTEVELNQTIIDEILSSCQVLHDLELLGCRGFDCLEVNNACVETLKIEECVDDATSLEISAPYVHTLDITVFPQRRKLLLKNISSVVAGLINIFEYGVGTGSELVMRNAKEFLENFIHVNKIHLSRQCFEVVSMMAVNGWQLPQFRHEHLTLVSCIGYEHCVPGIIGLLKSSPNLETLVLEGYGTEMANVIVDPSTKFDLDDHLFHLETVKFDNFTNRYGEPMATLAEILLKRALALEEMAIEMDVQDKRDILNIAKSLFNCCRSSPKARIKLSQYLRDESD